MFQFRHFRRILEDILIPGIEMNSRTLAGTSIGQPLMQGKCLEKILLTGRRVRDILRAVIDLRQVFRKDSSNWQES